ncbi:hypothetical protein IU487_22675 [Nocardia puris]|uniref:hypothetical protein n=1 Tax=Nocardia puris TaxID=208602 RepID=UPI001892F4A3|nr:hypothetical protein [Nocardia puris]MBF6213825.1 hypothetical protein [Nocardia puris]
MGAEVDPDRDGWPEYARAPRDVVPRRPVPPDAAPIPTGTVPVVHYEMTEHGVERVVEHLEVTEPVTGRNPR